VLAAFPRLEVDISDAVRDFRNYDIVIFDRLQAPAVQSGSFLFIASLPANLPLKEAGFLSFPRITAWERSHPLMDSLDMADVAISEAIRIETERGTSILVRSGQDALIAAGEQDGVRYVVISFDLFKSDLPLRPAFPVLMANTLQWLYSGTLDADTEQLQAGDSYPVWLSSDLSQGEDRFTVTITRPDGRKEQMAAASGSFNYEGTSTVGFYSVAFPGAEQQFAVNLLSESESDVNRRVVEPAVTQETGEQLRDYVKNPIWPVLAFISLLVLLAEWFFWVRKR
jgi:hypothetical protein